MSMFPSLMLWFLCLTRQWLAQVFLDCSTVGKIQCMFPFVLAGMTSQHNSWTLLKDRYLLFYLLCHLSELISFSISKVSFRFYRNINAVDFIESSQILDLWIRVPCWCVAFISSTQTYSIIMSSTVALVYSFRFQTTLSVVLNILCLIIISIF